MVIKIIRQTQIYKTLWPYLFLDKHYLSPMWTAYNLISSVPINSSYVISYHPCLPSKAKFYLKLGMSIQLNLYLVILTCNTIYILLYLLQQCAHILLIYIIINFTFEHMPKSRNILLFRWKKKVIYKFHLYIHILLPVSDKDKN